MWLVKFNRHLFSTRLPWRIFFLVRQFVVELSKIGYIYKIDIFKKILVMKVLVIGCVDKKIVLRKLKLIIRLKNCFNCVG